MNIIEYFKVEGLNQEKTININFFEKTTILVGENGSNKTTIMTILYYLLTNRFDLLENYDFDNLIIKYGNEEELSLDYDEIIKYAEDIESNKHRYSRYMRDLERILDIEIIEKIRNNRISEEELNKAFGIVNNKIGMPRRVFNQTINTQKYILNGNFAQIEKIIKINNTIRETHEILYFPTYRRIEEDYNALNRGSRIVPVNNDNSSKAFGELINFGMDDVRSRIDKLLNKIKNDSIENFNNMTSKLISQYLNTNLTKESNTSISDIKIALDRVGKYINDEQKNTIINMYETGEIDKDKHLYLKNLIHNIVDNYISLKEVDNKIESFIEICNKYLFDKKFIYNPSEVTLEILNSNNRVIPLKKLSSGEKQLVSTFSKILLEVDKKFIILFDEPELSLSLFWQKDFIYDISESNNCEFIMCVTHSPFIFDKLLDKTIDMNDSLSYGADNE